MLDGSASLHPLEWATVRNIMEQSLATLDIAPDRIYAGFVVFSTVVTYTSPQLIGNKQELLSGQSLSLSASPLPPAPSTPPLPPPPPTTHPHATFNEEAKRRSIAGPMDNTDTQHFYFFYFFIFSISFILFVTYKPMRCLNDGQSFVGGRTLTC